MLPDDDPIAEPPAPVPPRPSTPVVPAEVQAVDPGNRDAIYASIAELEEQAWRRREADEALPPPPPPPTRRWSVAIALGVLAVVVWVMPLVTRPRIHVVTAVPRNAPAARVERALQTAADLVEQYRLAERRLPASISLAGPVTPQIHYFPDTGGRFILEMPTTRGIARLTVERGGTAFQVFGPDVLRPAPPVLRSRR